MAPPRTAGLRREQMGALTAEVVTPARTSLIPLEKRARWAVVGLVAAGVALAFAVVCDWLQIDVLNRLMSGDRVTDGELDANDTRQALASFLYLVTVIV